MMDKRSARRKGLEIIRLDAKLDRSIGRSVDRDGHLVYGARRIQRERRDAIAGMLRAETGFVPTPAAIIPIPSAAQAGRISRGACALVGIAALAALALSQNWVPTNQIVAISARAACMVTGCANLLASLKVL